MLRYMRILGAAALIMLAAAGMIDAGAQTYPSSNPTYIPTAIRTAASLTGTGTPTIILQNIGSVTMRLTGTLSAVTAAPQVTNDPISAINAGTANWTTVSALPVAGGAPASSFTATGMWRVNTAGMTAARLNVTALTVTGSNALGVQLSGTHAGSAALTNSVDPCMDPNVPKLSAVVNAGASATTVVLPATTGKVNYLCGYHASLAGTTPSVTFKTGTRVSTDCDTGAVTVSGVILPTAGSMLSYGPGATLLTTPSNSQLCATLPGSSSLQGIATYVQQ